MNGTAIRRQLWIGCAAFLLILIVTGLSLSFLHRIALEKVFDRRLDVYVRSLIADVASLGKGDKFPQSTGEPLFELPLSGWYWQVIRLDARPPEMHSSRSLWESNMPHLPDDKSAILTELRQGYAIGPEDENLRLIERTIDLGDDGRYLISVAGDSSEITDAITSFNRVVFISFVSLSFVLVGITLILITRSSNNQIAAVIPPALAGVPRAH